MGTPFQTQKTIEKLEWIVFDAMGVIFEAGNNVKTLLLPFLKRFLPTIDYTELKQIYLKASLGEISAVQVWEHFGLGTKYPAIERDYLQSNFKLDPQFLPTVKELKKNYKIGLISNDVLEWARQLQAFYHIDALFDKILISGEIHIRKPDPQIFQYFLEGNNQAIPAKAIPASHCVLIDDKYSNLESAAKIGFHTILFQRTEKSIEPRGSFQPDGEISAFTQLSEKLKKIRDTFI